MRSASNSLGVPRRYSTVLHGGSRVRACTDDARDGRIELILLSAGSSDASLRANQQTVNAGNPKCTAGEGGGVDGGAGRGRGRG